MMNKSALEDYLQCKITITVIIHNVVINAQVGYGADCCICLRSQQSVSNIILGSTGKLLDIHTQYVHISGTVLYRLFAKI